MTKRVFIRVFISIVAVCLVLTIVHFIYAINAYQHCSIIQFIAKELW